MLDIEIKNAEVIRKRMTEISQREKEISNEEELKIKSLKESYSQERSNLANERYDLEKSCKHLNKNYEKSWKNKVYRLNLWFVCDDCGYSS